MCESFDPFRRGRAASPSPARSPVFYKRPQWWTGLEAIVAILQRDWVRDFIFETDCIADAGMLCAPLQRQYGFVMTNSIHQRRLQQEGENRFHFAADDVVLYSSRLQIPAFTAEGVTVGLMVEDIYPTANAPVASAPIYLGGRWMARFLLDSDSFIMITDRVEQDETDIAIYRSLILKGGTAVFFTFKRNRLIRVVENTATRNNIYSYYTALSCAKMLVNTQNCPMCRRSMENPCSCLIPYVKPSHPMDFNNLSRNFSSLLGEFKGPIKYQFFNEGSVISSSSLFLEGSVSSLVVPNAFEALSQWAVANRLGHLQVNLSRLQMPDSHRRLQNARARHADGSRSSGAHSSGTGSRDRPSSLKISSNEFGFESSPSLQTGPTNSPQIVPDLQSDDSPCQIVESLEAILTHGTGCAPLTPQGSDGALDLTAVGPASTHHLMDVPAPRVVPAVPDILPQPASTLQNPRAVPIAPLPVGTAPSPPNLVGQTERERKAYLRRIRNRETAARSNLKRKIRDAKKKAQQQQQKNSSSGSASSTQEARQSDP